MPFSKISVLVPTRKRLGPLNRMLQSFDATVTVPESAEVVLRIDADDRETLDALRTSPWTVVVGSRFDGYRSLPRFFEEMRAHATGDVFMCGNDDIVFKTSDWPTMLLAEAAKYPDGIFDLGVETFNAAHFPWSVVSRRAVALMGRLYDPRLLWHDLFLRDVMEHFGRAIRVSSVVVEHDWMGWHPDETFREADQGDPKNWDDPYWTLHRTCVDEAVKKLEAHRAAAA